MTNTRKALEMAIEALEDAQKSLDGQFSCGNCYTDVIQACKKALKQESLNFNCKSVQKRLAIQCGYVEQPEPRIFLDLSNSNGNHPIEQPAMTYEQGFDHGYEAHRVEQELEQPAQHK